MTKKEFLARIETCYELDLINPKTLNLLDKWIDAVMRFEGGQINYWVDFLESEAKRTGRFGIVLANDKDGYKLIQLTSILNHSCQECAEDPKAWHTRSAFCNHKK